MRRYFKAFNFSGLHDFEPLSHGSGSQFTYENAGSFLGNVGVIFHCLLFL